MMEVREVRPYEYEAGVRCEYCDHPYDLEAAPHERLGIIYRCKNARACGDREAQTNPEREEETT